MQGMHRTTPLGVSEHEHAHEHEKIILASNLAVQPHTSLDTRLEQRLEKSLEKVSEKVELDEKDELSGGSDGNEDVNREQECLQRLYKNSVN